MNFPTTRMNIDQDLDQDCPSLSPTARSAQRSSFQLKKCPGNVVLAEVQCQELLEGQSEPSASIEERLRQIEGELGVENTRIICQLLCCLPYGITMLEAADGYRLMKRTSGMSFEPGDVLAIAPLQVIKKLGMAFVHVAPVRESRGPRTIHCRLSFFRPRTWSW